MNGRALAHDLGLDALADPLRDHQALKVADVGHLLAVDGDDQVLGAQAGARGGAAGNDLDDLDPLLAAHRGGDARGQRARAADDAEVGAADAARR